MGVPPRLVKSPRGGAARGLLTPFRRFARRGFFGFLGRVAATEDAREILCQMLRGWLPHPGFGLNDRNRLPSGYGLPQSPATRDPQVLDTIFVTGRFRSGSTLLWNLFRHIPGCTAFYEPFNERQWFNRASRGDRVDPTHRGVTDYWREYEEVSGLEELWKESWTHRHLFMPSSHWEPAMKRFIENLITQSPSRPVLQFNRVDLRLPWLRRSFPGAKIVHIVRHPRDQWCSSLLDMATYPMEADPEAFPPHDHFYQALWALDLRYTFPFLDSQNREHPYRVFYLLWRLSYLFGINYSDVSISFEELVTDPQLRISELLGALGIREYDLAELSSLIQTPRIGKWRDYAEDAWFRRHETECERTLAEFLDQVEP